MDGDEKELRNAISLVKQFLESDGTDKSLHERAKKEFEQIKNFVELHLLKGDVSEL